MLPETTNFIKKYAVNRRWGNTPEQTKWVEARINGTDTGEMPEPFITEPILNPIQQTPIRFYPNQLKKMREIAENTGVTINDFVRESVDIYLDKLEGKFDVEVLVDLAEFAEEFCEV